MGLLKLSYLLSFFWKKKKSVLKYSSYQLHDLTSE